MLVLVGGSASGKSTIEKILCSDYGYNKVISYTTRKPRVGEQDGIDYYFITEEEFAEKKKSGFFAEVGAYNGWNYGSARIDCTNDKVAVLTPHGLRQMKRISNLDIISIFIDVPRRDRLIKILERQDNIDEAKRRDGSDVGQFDGIEDEVDHIIKNDGYKNNAESMARQVDFMYKTLLTNRNKVRTILCDIDEVVNNLVSKVLEKYNEKYGDDLSLDDITDYEIKKFLKPECTDIFKEFCSDDFLYSLEIQPKTIEVIDVLMTKYKFYFVSSKHPEHVAITDKWLDKYFQHYDRTKLIICKNKKMISGDILIDDCLENFEINNNNVGNVRYNFIFDKPWNRSYKEDKNRSFRVHDWNDILKTIYKLEGIE